MTSENKLLIKNMYVWYVKITYKRRMSNWKLGRKRGWRTAHLVATFTILGSGYLGSREKCSGEGFISTKAVWLIFSLFSCLDLVWPWTGTSWFGYDLVDIHWSGWGFIVNLLLIFTTFLCINCIPRFIFTLSLPLRFYGGNAVLCLFLTQLQSMSLLLNGWKIESCGTYSR